MAYKTSLFLLVSSIGSSAASYVPRFVQELHIRQVESRPYPLMPRFPNATSTSTTSSSSSSSDGAPLITFPPPTSVSTSIVSPVSTNTHTNINGVEVPVLHGCGFCPAGLLGLLLFGIPVVAGVYPPPIPPPFPGFPTITIGEDGNPTTGDVSSTSSSDSSTDSTTTTTSSTSTTSTTSTTSSSISVQPLATMLWEEWQDPEDSSDEAYSFADALLSSVYGSDDETTTTSSTTLSTTSSQTTSSSTSSTTPPPTTTTSTSMPPSCSTETASARVCTLCEGSVDPVCTPVGPPAPSETSSNAKGSALCKSAISGDDCKNAYHRYDPSRIYTGYTSYTYTNWDSAVNVIVGAGDGCTAIFRCENDEAYARGMGGWAIIQAFDNLYANDGVGTCGSAYFDNGCSITANACSGCKDVNT